MNENQSFSKLTIGIIVAAVIVAVAIVYASREFARILERPALDESSLAENVSKQVLEKLEKSPLIADQMQAAIEDFQKKRAQTQAQQRAEAQRLAAAKAKNVRPPSPERDHIRGNPKATISLIEYSDFECPFCKRFHETPKRLLKIFGDDLNWVYRHFPLSFHNPGAQKQAEAAECVNELGGPELFWKFTDAIYARTKAGGRGFPIPGLTPLAREIGVEKDAFEACLNGGKYTQKVKNDLAEGARAGVTGTPGSILRNNETGEVVLISGARPITEFEQAIRKLQKGAEEKADAAKKPAS